MRLHIENLQQQIEDLNKKMDSQHDSEIQSERYKHEYDELRERYASQQ